MRNRSLILILSVLVATLLVAGCGQTRQLTQQEQDRLENIKGLIELAEMKDAKSCAPKELAYSQATLETALIECTEGWEKCDAGKRPKGAAADAQKAVDALMKKMQACEDAKKVPSITVTVEPEMVPPGKCATIKWTTENVDRLLFGTDNKKAKSPELPLYGSKEVCPKETTEYQLSGVGPKLTVYEFATVKVGEPPPPPPPPAPKPMMMAPPPPPPPPPAPKPMMMEKVELHINFAPGKAAIPKSEDMELQKAIDAIKKYPDAKISVIGYTDSMGAAKYNQMLSEKRAKAVKAYLEGKGVKADRIAAEGKGEANPIGDNKTKEGRAKNRRVDVEISQ